MYFVNVEIKVYITDETDQFISELFCEQSFNVKIKLAVHFSKIIQIGINPNLVVKLYSQSCRTHMI